MFWRHFRQGVIGEQFAAPKLKNIKLKSLLPGSGNKLKQNVQKVN